MDFLIFSSPFPQIVLKGRIGRLDFNKFLIILQKRPKWQPSAKLAKNYPIRDNYGFNMQYEGQGQLMDQGQEFYAGQQTFGQQYTCSYCSRVFQTRTGLRKHTSKHTGRYLYFCENCNKGFNEVNKYEEHMNKHKGIGFKCMKCNRSLYTMKLLLKHQETCY